MRSPSGASAMAMAIGLCSMVANGKLPDWSFSWVGFLSPSRNGSEGVSYRHVVMLKSRIIRRFKVFCSGGTSNRVGKFFF